MFYIQNNCLFAFKVSTELTDTSLCSFPLLKEMILFDSLLWPPESSIKEKRII